MGMATSDWVYFPKRDRLHIIGAFPYTYLPTYYYYLLRHLYLIGCLISVRTTPHHVS